MNTNVLGAGKPQPKVVKRPLNTLNTLNFLTTKHSKHSKKPRRRADNGLKDFLIEQNIDHE